MGLLEDFARNANRLVVIVEVEPIVGHPALDESEDAAECMLVSKMSL
jgi:hypothetical protein